MIWNRRIYDYVKVTWCLVIWFLITQLFCTLIQSKIFHMTLLARTLIPPYLYRKWYSKPSKILSRTISISQYFQFELRLTYCVSWMMMGDLYLLYCMTRNLSGVWLVLTISGNHKMAPPQFEVIQESGF